MGVDKYSDVLDSEIAEVDFTNAYMNSIANPRSIERNILPVQSEMKQQLENNNRYKDIIREEKDLASLVGQDSEFDINIALREMLACYEKWKGHDLSVLHTISVTDEEIVRHLKADILHDRKAEIMHVKIYNFPNEAGYFMLWTLSITDDAEGKRTIPIFINENYILRPMAGRRLMDVFLNTDSYLSVSTGNRMADKVYEKLETMSMEFAYDTFVEMRDKRLSHNEESYRKYMYALKLRMEAAERIGIENIRSARLRRLESEKSAIEADYQKGRSIYPDFKLALLLRLEA